jgi:OHCU decarboxylase
MESIYEYGSRAGFWRLWRMFTDRGLPLTVYGVATALARNPEAVAAMREAGWEIASHGLKWIDYQFVGEAAERQHMADAIRIHAEVTGERPLGWYTGRASPNTLRLVAEEGGFLYCADSYADDLPYWANVEGKRQLIVPYTLDANDMRFATPQGFNSGEQFYQYLKDSFDVLYEEGRRGSPKMMSVGLHCRLVGRPGRIAALARFLDHVQRHDGVWVCRRLDIARHWHEHHAPRRAAVQPTAMGRAAFVAAFGHVYEHSPWVAEAAFDRGLPAGADTAEGLHAALAAVLRGADEDRKLELINAHPDLAGRLARAGRLTAESTREQAGAGLDQLTDAERERFTALNEAYKARFGFPFIMAVKGRSKDDILAAFERRLGHDREAELATALAEVDRIALLRLRDLVS